MMLVFFVRLRFIGFLLFSLSLLFCSNQPDSQPDNEEEKELPPFVAVSKGTVSAALMKSVITGSPSVQNALSGLGIVVNDITYDARLFKLTYDTMYAGRKIRASAMIAVPRKDGELSLVAVQHGTILANQEAPSEWSLATAALTNALLEGLFDTMVGGQVSVNVDYLGFGKSHDQFSIHPYLIRDSYPQDIISAIQFTKQFAQQENINLTDQLFLRGYSEGAFATLAAQQVIESSQILKDDFTLQAVAVGAGPYDLLRTVAKSLSAPSGNLGASSYAPYLYLASEQAYGWETSRMNAIFRTDTNVIRELFNRKNTRMQIETNAAVPASLSALFKSDALSTLKTSAISNNDKPIFREFKEKLRDNSLHSGWIPTAPIRLYHCTHDEIVTSENTTDYAVDLVGGISNDITLTHASTDKSNSGYILDSTMGPIHASCPLYGLPIKEWFKKF